VYFGLPGNNDWGCSFPTAAGVPSDYELEYDSAPASPGCLTPMPTSNSAQTDHLYFNPSSTLYSYSIASPAVKSDFTRDVRITNNGDEIDVQSIVAWTDGTLSNTITLEDHFYNWHP
jgi:hypothetical protein